MSHERTPTVGYGTADTKWTGLDVATMVSDVVEGACPACHLELHRETLLTYNRNDPEEWGCCRCCSRAWLFTSESGLKATACVEHTNWDCPHPLPGGTWTPAAHAAAWPAVRRLAMGASVADLRYDRQGNRA